MCWRETGFTKAVFKNEPDDRGSARMVLVGVEAMTPGALKQKSMICSFGHPPISWITPVSRQGERQSMAVL